MRSTQVMAGRDVDAWRRRRLENMGPTIADGMAKGTEPVANHRTAVAKQSIRQQDRNKHSFGVLHENLSKAVRLRQPGDYLTTDASRST